MSHRKSDDTSSMLKRIKATVEASGAKEVEGSEVQELTAKMDQLTRQVAELMKMQESINKALEKVDKVDVLEAQVREVVGLLDVVVNRSGEVRPLPMIATATQTESRATYRDVVARPISQVSPVHSQHSNSGSVPLAQPRRGILCQGVHVLHRTFLRQFR